MTPLRSLNAPVAAALLLFSPLTLDAQAQALDGTRPNIILIMCDDAGFADFGFTGGEIPTPNLDRLAKEGTVLSQFYNESRCMPTRGALLTGLSANLAFSTNGKPTGGYELGDSCVTVAEVLRSAGYATYMAGKWHVGMPKGGKRLLDAQVTEKSVVPTQRGFEKFHGTWTGAISFSKEAMSKHNNILQGKNAIIDQETPLRWEDLPDDYYTTFSWTRKAIGWIEETPKEKPFFLYLAYTAPHWPLSPKPEYIERAKGIYKDGWDAARARIFARQKEMGYFKENTVMAPLPPQCVPFDPNNKDALGFSQGFQDYCASIIEMDDAIGELVAALEKSGRAENTLLLFLTDNGAENLGRSKDGGASTAVSNTPFYGAKLTMFEGGIRTPLLAWWPKKIPGGKVNTVGVGHVTDFMNTFVALAGATYPETARGNSIPKSEGRNLMPLLTNAQFGEPRQIGFEHEVQKAYRDGDWKIVEHNYFSITGPTTKTYSSLYATEQKPMSQWMLFNLAQDPTELKNIASEHPEKCAELAAKWQAWSDRTATTPRIERIKSNKQPNSSKRRDHDEE